MLYAGVVRSTLLGWYMLRVQKLYGLYAAYAAENVLYGAQMLLSEMGAPDRMELAHVLMGVQQHRLCCCNAH